MPGTRLRGRLSAKAILPALSAGVLAMGLLSFPTASGVASAASSALRSQPTGEAAALATATATGQRVEVVGKTTDSEQTFANPDGTMTLEQTAVPVRARRAAGWVPVDTTLVRRADGSVAPVAGAMDVVFSGGGASAPMARVSKGGTTLALGWSGALPVPTLAGDTATYAEVLPGVDLTVRATADGFADVLVVKTAQAARQPALQQVRFTSKLSGGTLRGATAGGFGIVDRLGSPIFTSPQAIMWDSTGASPETGRASSALGASAGHSGPGDRSRVVPMVERADSVSVSITPDQAMLVAPVTQFPVYIDPVVSAARQIWSMVNRTYPTTPSYNWSAASEGVGYNDPAGVNVKRLYWNFNTAATRGKHILNATFKALELFSYSCTAAPVDLWQANPITPTTTWNAQPANLRLLASRTVAFGRDGCYPSGQWVEFNALAAAADSAAKNVSVTGFALRANETGNTGWKRFRNDALLSITYNTAPSTPTNLRRATTPCHSVNDAGMPVVPNDQPLFVANFTDPDGGNVVGAFGLYVIPSTGPLQTVKTWANTAAPSGADQSVRAPALADGKYVWQTRAYDGVDYSVLYSVPCYFRVDGNAPPSPTVTVPAGQVFKVGTAIPFTFGNGGATDVVKYKWALNDTTPGPADVLASAPTISISPKAFGPSVLRVWSYDAAGNQGSPAPNGGLEFTVAPSPETALWPVDEAAGSIITHTTGPGTFPMTVVGGATRTTGRWFDGDPGDLAINFDGASGSAATASNSVVDTSDSFSVAAWVRLSGATVRRVAVGKDGATGNAFSIGFVPGGQDSGGNPIAGSFAFTMLNPAGVEAVAREPVEAAMSDWVHLVGVFGAAGRTLTLYVNGEPVGAASLNGAPTAVNGVVTMGRGRTSGAAGSFWSGDVDDVHVFGGAIDESVARALFTTTRPVR